MGLVETSSRLRKARSLKLSQSLERYAEIRGDPNRAQLLSILRNSLGSLRRRFFSSPVLSCAVVLPLD